jgi:hypothetical protein
MGGVDNGLLPGGTVLGAVLGGSTKTLAANNLPATLNLTGGTTVTGTVSLSNVLQLTGGGVTFPTGAGTTVYPAGSVNSVSNPAITGTGTFSGAQANAGGGVALSVLQLTFVCNKILKVH